MTGRLAHIYRFPVKGLRGEPLAAVTLTAGEGLPHDRRFAVARGDAGLDPAAPRWRPKQWFIMLMRDTALACVTCRLDEAAETIELHAPGTAPCRAPFGTPDGRRRIEGYLNDCLGQRREGRAYWTEARAVSFTDVPQNCLTLVNLASVRDLATRMGTTLTGRTLGTPPAAGVAAAGGALDPLRFRANLYIDGLAAWTEFDWVGNEIRIGDVVLRIPARIPRCAATSVDPDTGERSINVVKGLQTAYGHIDMGVYAEVVRGGPVRLGDPVTPPDDATPRTYLGHWMRFIAFLAESVPIVLRGAPRR